MLWEENRESEYDLVTILDVYSTSVYENCYVIHLKIDGVESIGVLSYDESISTTFPFSAIKVIEDSDNQLTLELCPPKGTVLEYGHPDDLTVETI